MKIWVDRLSANPEEITESPGRDWWTVHFGRTAQDEGEFELAEGPVFHLLACLKGQKIHLKGNFELGLDAQCGRCLKRYRHDLQDSFRLLLEPVAENAPLDPEGRAALERTGIGLGEELETGWYRGNELELDDFLAELISLSWPLQAVCQDDCPGLCPQCGVDRSKTDCDCEVPKPESPFAVLEALRGKNTGSV
ncbi:MAG: DUF177 domain-containing protein [Myxococcota bacterium]|nr:DUF177 domain-containing protein [Myxococcota bacterium]